MNEQGKEFILSKKSTIKKTSIISAEEGSFIDLDEPVVDFDKVKCWYDGYILEDDTERALAVVSEKTRNIIVFAVLTVVAVLLILFVVLRIRKKVKKKHRKKSLICLEFHNPTYQDWRKRSSNA